MRPHDHVDYDIWARSCPPLRGFIFPDRQSAKQSLMTGALCAEREQVVPETESQVPDAPLPFTAGLADVDKGTMGPVRPNDNMPRVESMESRVSRISSAPSFGKIREPLSADSLRLESEEEHEPPGRRPRVKRSAMAEYEEFGSEALITHVYDDLEDEFDESSPSALFHEIGPSVSLAGPTSFSPPPVNLKNPHSLPPPPLYSTPYEEAIEVVTSPSAPYASSPYDSPTPPPPPPPLYRVSSYGETPIVPPPPSPPPHPRDDGSPVTEELFSDLATSYDKTVTEPTYSVSEVDTVRSTELLTDDTTDLHTLATPAPSVLLAATTRRSERNSVMQNRLPHVHSH